MNKRVGILGLLVAAAVGFFHPAVASAQDRYDIRGGYAQRDYREGHNRDWHNDYRYDRRDFRQDAWREARERQEIRDRAWRERERCERGYPPVYGYRAPGVGLGFSWYGR